MSVKHDSLCILSASIILESAAIKTSLLAKSGNSLTVIVSKAIHLKDSFSYIRSTHEVNFEKLGLEVAFIWTISN
jgi:hypothetical protein